MADRHGGGRRARVGRSAAAVPRFDVSVELHAGDRLTSVMLPGVSLAVDEILAAG